MNTFRELSEIKFGKLISYPKTVKEYIENNKSRIGKEVLSGNGSTIEDSVVLSDRSMIVKTSFGYDIRMFDYSGTEIKVLELTKAEAKIVKKFLK